MLAASIVVATALGSASRAEAVTLHQAVSLRAPYIAFYAGHLVLEALGGAYLDDGVHHVSANRVVLDLRTNSYVAAGAVTVCSPDCVTGSAFGDDLESGVGRLVSVAGSASSTDLCPLPAPCAPAAVAPTLGMAPADPLRLPDTEGEAPFAVAVGAVAHLSADVRLQDARVLVPGSRTFFFPSYVYAFSSDPGYALTNVPGAGEDVPVYVGSTRNSILGLHFMYNPVTKVAVGVDEHIVNGQKSYLLLSEAPVIGPDKIANATWLLNVNEHTSQTMTASAIEGLGIINTYDLRDAVHRSFVELTANQFHAQYAGVVGWQSFDEPLAATGLGSLLVFHLRSEYGVTYTPQSFSFYPLPPDAIVPNRVYHAAVEAYAATRPLQIGSSTTLNFSADDRMLRDSLPHTQTQQIFAGNLQYRWTPHLTTSMSEIVSPVHDYYPTVAAGVSTTLNTQSYNAFYSNGNAFGLTLSALHDFGYTDSPFGIVVQPWLLATDVRFRVNRTLALDISRSYNFNFEGRTWGGFGIQILP